MVSGGVHAIGTGLDDALADDDGAVQVSAAGNNHRLGIINGTQLGTDTGNGTVFRQHVHDLGVRPALCEKGVTRLEQNSKHIV